jgi:hypothetical protein
MWLPQDRQSWVKTLGILGWLVIAIGGVAGFIVNPTATSEADDSILVIGMAVFSVILMARLILASITWPNRRSALVPLMVGIALWFAGAQVLSAAVPASATAFPAPGEWLFLSSYVALTAFLVLDVSNRSSRAGTAWLDAAILCGAVGALAGGLLLTPFVQSFPEGGIPLLVAILYPLIDVALGLLVVGQWALSSRSWGRSTVGLILGFLALAIADSSLVLNLSLGTYEFSTILSLVWGAAFALIADAAIAPRPPQVSVARRMPGAFLVASFLVAITLLLVRPTGVLGWAISVPAAVTLLATGARLAVARVPAGRGGLPDGADRRSHRAAEPPRRAAGARRRHRLAGTAWPDAPRPGRLQGGQRHPRPQCGRHPSRARRPAHA